MPILTGTIFAWSPSATNTTSIGLAASLDFLSLLFALVLLLLSRAIALVFAGAELVAAAIEFVDESFGLSFGMRVVTLAMGTVRMLVRYRVSISAVTDIPGRNPSFSLTRIFTPNLVASC